MSIRIVLGEDNVLVREGVRALLDSYDDVEVVGVAEDAPSLLAAAAEHVPDVVGGESDADDYGDGASGGGSYCCKTVSPLSAIGQADSR